MNVKQENFKRISDNRNMFASIQNELDKQKEYFEKSFKKETKKEKL